MIPLQLLVMCSSTTLLKSSGACVASKYAFNATCNGLASAELHWPSAAAMAHFSCKEFACHNNYSAYTKNSTLR
jgi:hypothetical protein